ncbi:phosphatidylinositol phosphatase PTPRQ-like, partial [Anneissia japonica]|uniref:phosphatidylinositol phosphatase PTPRQ-like n=1 Tax=Anneissia japonica TaxID=1529436 RepID=UPI001425B087
PERVENFDVQGSKLVWDRPQPLTCDILNYHINLSLTEKDQCQQVYRNEQFTTEDAEINLSELEPYSTHQVTISAETDAGLGLETTHEFGTPEKVPKRGPKEVNITAVSATGASFAWSEIECGYRRGRIRGYKFSLQNTDGKELITNETSELQCEFNNLNPFTDYIFSVKGFNSKGDGKSQEIHVTTNESIPSDVRNIEIRNTDTKSFRIKWSRPKPPNGIVVMYQINYTVMDGFENDHMSVIYDVPDGERDKIDFITTIEDLRPNTNYSVQLKLSKGYHYVIDNQYTRLSLAYKTQAAAFTSVGIGPWSDEFYVFTTTGKPGPVDNLLVEYATETDLHMTWEQPLNPNGVVTNYHVSSWHEQFRK